MCRSHKVRSRAGITYRGHVEGSRARGMQVAQGDLHLQMGGVIIVKTLWVKRRCQLVVGLKANKCYQGLLCYLPSYINLPNTTLFARVFGKCYWQCNHPRVHPDCIAGHIALIADLIADCITLIWSIVCIISSKSPSDPRRNSPPWWITYLHLNVLRVRPIASDWPSPSPLTAALLVAFFCRAWGYSSRSITTESRKTLTCK